MGIIQRAQSLAASIGFPDTCLPCGLSSGLSTIAISEGGSFNEGGSLNGEEGKAET